MPESATAVTATNPAADIPEQLKLSRRAIAYVLGRIKENPHIGYHMGWGSSAYEHLKIAMAALTGDSTDEVEKAFTPAQYDGQPLVLVLNNPAEKMPEKGNAVIVKYFSYTDGYVFTEATFDGSIWKIRNSAGAVATDDIRGWAKHPGK